MGISVEGREMAEVFWLLEAKKSLLKQLSGKKLAKLVPRIKDGIIEVGGRTDRWIGFNWNRQLFILVPGDHNFSDFVVCGWPQTFFSDNGTHIVAASKGLKQVISGFDLETLHSYSVSHGIRGKSSPTPWYNIDMEALMKSVKKCLNGTTRDLI